MYDLKQTCPETPAVSCISLMWLEIGREYSAVNECWLQYKVVVSNILWVNFQFGDGFLYFFMACVLCYFQSWTHLVYFKTLPNTRNSRENDNFLSVRLQKNFNMLTSIVFVNSGAEYMYVILNSSRRHSVLIARWWFFGLSSSFHRRGARKREAIPPVMEMI